MGPGSRPGRRGWIRRFHHFRFNCQTAERISVRVLAARCARGLHEPFPLKTEGAGNAGCPLHPQPRVRSGWCTRVYSPQVHRALPGVSCAMVLTAYFVLSPVTGLSCHRRSRIPANLTPASGRQDHTALPSAASVIRPRADCAPDAAASTASRPASVTIAIRPSEGWDGGINKAASTKTRSGIFFETGLDRKIAKQPVGQIGMSSR
jgi:hypothetical protein